MPPARRQLFRLFSLSLVSLAAAGCTPPDDPTATLATSFTTLPTTTFTTTDPTDSDTDETSTTESMETSTTDPTDTDPTATDTDPTATDTDPTDTDPTATDTDPTATDTDPTDTDPTDTDPTTDSCDDGDSGNEPFEDEGVFQSANDGAMPHGGFVPDEDFGTPSECGIFMQDCPLGEKCVPYSSNGGNWNANKCVPVQGNGMVGESCQYAGTIEATDDCDADSACWDVMEINGQQIGTCTAFCGGTPEAPVCPQGTSCLQSGDGSIAFCVDTCNPLTQECPPGEACFWANDAFNCIFTTSEIPVGQPCGFINDCAEGLICLTAEVVPNCGGGACCGEFCDLDCGGNPCTQPGTVCTPFFSMGMAPFGDGDVGVCILP